MPNLKYIIPDWQEIYEIAKETTNKIKESDFYPDVIVAVSRGGLVPGRLFADFLHIKDVYTIKADHWGLTATKDGEAKLSHGLSLDLNGKMVLIVDDITDTGESMKLAKEHIETKNPTQVKTATIYHLKNSKYIPDFFGEEKEWAWIIFPWNYREDMVNLINKIDNSNEKSFIDLKKELKENYEIDLHENEVLEIIDHIKFLNKKNERN